MGDRVNFVFAQEDGNAVVLYSHWGWTGRHEDLAAALGHAYPRWEDESYCVRMAISHLLADDLRSELGYGIFAININDGGLNHLADDYVVIDLANKTADGKPFAAYIAYHLTTAGSWTN